MQRHMHRIRIFRAMASPAYMAMTYLHDPVEHAFNMAKRAELGMQREPEFKSEFVEISQKCRAFAASILHSCRTSCDVEMVLADNSIPCDCGDDSRVIDYADVSIMHDSVIQHAG